MIKIMIDLTYTIESQTWFLRIIQVISVHLDYNLHVYTYIGNSTSLYSPYFVSETLSLMLLVNVGL
jgi:hypothetical protein